MKRLKMALTGTVSLVPKTLSGTRGAKLVNGRRGPSSRSDGFSNFHFTVPGSLAGGRTGPAPCAPVLRRRAR